ncbi:hypothetical protein [Bosea sp. NBC_00550]|uniref:hypothetical protein n=1 Tax=Bosea sp. NBC_00550 TaxID=2969621 RepID=UPI00222F76B7|nr:hypothetical protein [Bosea sp. NBC_00550]UZF95430.1 hypothetical protein NWE53_28525 [Bosea sp. NBC_00550]
MPENGDRAELERLIDDVDQQDRCRATTREQVAAQKILRQVGSTGDGARQSHAIERCRDCGELQDGEDRDCRHSDIGGLMGEDHGVVGCRLRPIRLGTDAHHRADDQAELEIHGEIHREPDHRVETEGLETERACQQDGRQKIADAAKRLVAEGQRGADGRVQARPETASGPPARHLQIRNHRHIVRHRQGYRSLAERAPSSRFILPPPPVASGNPIVPDDGSLPSPPRPLRCA